ncbi:MAG: preprotein translocase subunit SecA [Turneriella sp.]|nr:preprotein translocase subunit SecA [Turneriella sp.]
MLQFVLKAIFGSKYERDLKRIRPYVERINTLEPEIQKLSDAELAAKTPAFKERLANGEKLISLLPEAFAVLRETSVRTLKMRHFDVQLMGAMALNEGKISEMKTGEGKTLTATLAVYLNALVGRGVHLVTVNDYLAGRDAEWMRPLYAFHGLTTGVIKSNMPHTKRREAYAADITYGTNNEYGFDYLRDNMVDHRNYRVQRDHYFAIVDEVDSILIDEARTPLIISGPADQDAGEYVRVNKVIPALSDKVDYDVDEKARSVLLTEIGVHKVEKLLNVDNLYAPQNVELVHHVHQCLKAHKLFNRDVDYVVQGGEIIIVDEFTGRLMEGRRYSDGLHQAIEAKEKVDVKQENQTLATITFQNFFRMYEKLAGMTGTADTEAEEFRKIYKLDVMVIPPNRKMIRKDAADKVYRTQREKFNAIADEVKDLHLKGQPVLLGTISIENSEKLSKLLTTKGIPHSVLNAKFHDQEAQIIKDAGQRGRVTIATNMAGRGTDILLGEGVRELGGLHIVGSERHESRRIDNQLRGRAGRQGDPGSSRFYLSLEDELMRIFGSDRLGPIMQRFGMQEGEALEHRMVTNAIERAQKRVESHHFEMRKHLLEYDDVMNKQRKYIYMIRNEILDNADVKSLIREFADDAVNVRIEQLLPGKKVSEYNFDALAEYLNGVFQIKYDNLEDAVRGVSKDEFIASIRKQALDAFNRKEEEIGAENMRILEKMIALQVIDQKWKDHLYLMDQLRDGIWTLGYAERNPLVEYRFRAFAMFEDMVAAVKDEVTEFILKAQVKEQLHEEEAIEAEYHEVGSAQHSTMAGFDMTDGVAAQAAAKQLQNRRPDATTSEAAKQTGGGSSKRKSSRRR